MAMLEISDFLSHFNSNSYNRMQIGNDKQLVIKIYEFLDKLSLCKEDKEVLINNISYLRRDNINVPLFLELLTKSLGFQEEYSLSKIIKVVRDVHDIYFSSNDMSMEDYVHLTEENRIKRIFFKKFKSFDDRYIQELRFALAIGLDNKEYNDFLCLLSSNGGSLELFNKYINIRENLKDEVKLYWDIYFGMEYLIILNKTNIPFRDIFKAKKKSIIKVKELDDPIQLDMFSYLEENDDKLSLDSYGIFQIDTIYKTENIPDIDKEQDLLDYYNNVVKRNKYIALPKIKGKETNQYIFLNK